MILIMVMQEFDQKLTEVSGLLQNTEASVPSLGKNAAGLVMELETMAQRYGLHIQAELALIRGRLLCGYPEEKGTGISRKEREHAKLRYIVEQLEKAVTLVGNHFKNARAQFEECEKVCGQIIVNAHYRGLVQNGQDLYTVVSQDPELAPHLAQVQGAVGYINAKVIFESAKIYTRMICDS